MVYYIDVHTHLDDEQFKHDIDVVMHNANEANVKLIIQNGSTLESNKASLALAARYPTIKVALGAYPIDAQQLYPDEFEALLKFIESHKDDIVAIGEIGLDYHWETKANRQEHQRKNFRKLLALARKIDKPVIVHTRDAEQDAIKILKEECMKRVVLHCFGGKISLAKEAAEMGWMFSIPPNVVRSSHFQEIVKAVNINNILTETDAPYMGPVVNERNEPKHIPLAVQKIAEIKGMTERDAMTNIFLNVQRMF